MTASSDISGRPPWALGAIGQVLWVAQFGDRSRTGCVRRASTVDDMASTRRARNVAQKMGIKPGARAHLRDAPPAAVAAMGLPNLDLAETLTGEFDYLHLFVVRQDRMRAQFGGLRDRLSPGGMLWVSWPKGGKLGTDLTIKSVIAIGYDQNMVESTCLRIDETWAGLKFTHPKPGKTYTNSYGTLPSHNR